MKKYLLAAVALLTALTAAAQAKYVFYFIGDGMGLGHINATEQYRRDVLKTPEPLLMLTFPYGSVATSYSASSPITDSAAAGTALSTGHKTKNSMVGMAPDTTNVYSIASDFMKQGRAVGVVTSVAGDDATPAAFYAHSPSRYMSKEISGFAPQSGVQFFGAPMFRGMYDSDKKPTDWVERMEKAGYRLVHSEAEYLDGAREGEKTLMLAANPQGEQLGYTLDAVEGTLTLQEITETALGNLSTDPDGFFLMVEGGNIDWASHANDGASVIREILNFQNAIDVAYRFYLAHPDETLIVITADHDTGGMAVGRADNAKNPRLDLIGFQKISKDRFADWCRENYKDKAPTWEEMRSFLEQNLSLWQGIGITEEEEKVIRESFDATFITHRAKDQKTLYNDFNNFTVTLYDILNRHYGIGWTSPSHTSNFTPVYAVGAGAELFAAPMNNIDIPAKILKAAAVK